jgi:hypothetical protein
MRVALTPCEKLEIRADTDDLGGGIEGSSEIFDDCGREPHGALFQRDIGLVGMAYQPVVPAEKLHLRPGVRQGH